MVEKVIKYDGSVEDFDPNKLNHWAEYACKTGGDWAKIAIETFKRLPKESKSSDIHQAMLDVCYAEESLEYSKIAARLEVAQLRKNMERKLDVRPNSDSWKSIRKALIKTGIWCKNTLPEYTDEQEQLYQEIKGIKLDAWQVGQWADKYIVKIDDVPVETPQVAAMGIGLGLLGDNWLGHHLVKYIIESKINLPTPILNGVRNGNFDGVSCCVISVGDSVASLAVGDHLAMVMTAKKAGIGYEATVRTKGSSVKNGAVKHLGKHPIYKSLDGSVKLLTQMTRGGSATVTFNAIDPEVEQIALWKSQRIDIEQRLDKLDYSFAFNDAFLEAVVKRKDWYLFDYGVAPELYDAFYTASVDEYNELVDKLVSEGKHHTKTNALDLLKHVLLLRNETGRIYTFNVSRANEHTPFNEVIRLSNLCQEIALPTTPYCSMEALYNDTGTGETAFCTLAALVPANIKEDEYEDVAYVAVKALTKLIELCPKLTKNHKRTMLDRMSLGIGVTGLAEYLYQNGLDYDGSDKSLEFVHDYMERHYYSLLKASIRIAKETGKSVKAITDWLPIDTKRSKWSNKQDWESLRGLPRAHSVLTAIMPTESSSLASGVTNSVYPPRQKVVNKKSRKGVVQFICSSFEVGKNLTAWEVDNITLSKYYGVIQDFTDQGISADSYFNPKLYSNGKKPMSELIKEWVAHYRLGNKSQYYVNTMDVGEGSIHDLEEVEEDCESCKL